MKMYRVLLAFLLLSIAASCSNPAGPRFPGEDDDSSIPPDDDRAGFLISEEMGFFV